MIDLSSIDVEEEAFEPQTRDGKSFEDFLNSVRNSPEKSVMAQIVRLPEDEQKKALDGIDPETLLYDWRSWARPSQLLPDDGWNTAVFCAGRGFGKTRVGSEWVREVATKHPGCRIALLARTAADTRDTMVLGESGVLAVHPESERPNYVPSRRSIVWPNGSQATLYSDVESDSLRGPQFNYAWADEIATFNHMPDASGLTAWNNLRIATRLGKNPQVITTTTPKRVPVIQDLFEEAASTGSRTIIRRGRTIDNEYLSNTYLEVLWSLYSQSSAMWRQEVLGELIGDIEGALWLDTTINKFRAPNLVPALPYRVVAVDPSVAESPRDECGIVVVGGTAHRKLHERHAYVLEDASVLGSPEVWARAVVEQARKWKCPVVAEGNQGQALVQMAIRSIDPNVPVFLVQARRNKVTRAEPISVAYEAGRVHHRGYLPTLESQLTTWIPGETKKSPDRLDALVWGVTALLVAPPKGLTFGGPVRASSPASRSLGGITKRFAGHRSSRAA